LTGSLILDFLGNPNANFVFQIGSTLTTSSSSSVTVINGGSLNGVYWDVGSSATLGTDTVFAGNLLALASVTLDPRAEILCGRAFALTGAVAGTDNLASDNCAIQNFGSGTSDFGSRRSRALYACATVCGLWRRPGARADSLRRFVAPQRRMID
jgi:Ice-binding-like